MMRNVIIILFLCFANILLAQNDDLPNLKIFKSGEKIKVDGVLDEKIWTQSFSAKDFQQHFPFDSSAANTKTEIRLTYDEDFLYVAAICHDEMEGDYIVQSLKRDFSYTNNDNLTIIIDPFNDLTNGFAFTVSPLNVQSEALIQFGGGQGLNTSWDNVWYSAVTRNENHWMVEIAIPFKTLRFNEGNKVWRMNFNRQDLKRNENSSWVRVPRNFNISSLAFTGEVHWDEAPKKNSSNVSIIPYGITTLNADYQNDTTFIKPNVGLDAKIAITSSLNLDLTINPDFAQVDVDRQVTNLSRFSLFFPERRYFFIENSDIFERFGFRQIRPFFSRRIGLNNGNTIPIIGGARLSGKLNKNWRIGLMNMHTRAVEKLEVTPENYTVAALMRQLKGRSNIAAIFVNRQGFDDYNWRGGDYNRVVGLDWNIFTLNNKVSGKVFYHHSFSPGLKDDNFAHASWLMYESPNLLLMWNHEYVGKNFISETGFVPRNEYYDPINNSIEHKSYWRWEPMLRYKFYPKNSRINNHGLELYLSEYWDGQYSTIERLASVTYSFKFQNTSYFNVTGSHNRVKLFFDQDITFSGNNFVESGFYNYNTAQVEYQSDQRKLFNLYSSFNAGTYFNGNKYTSSLDLNFRKQPWGIFSLSFQSNYIQMPEGFHDVNLILIGPKIELSFTRKLFFTTFIQYNTQLENLNINSRLQWRFRPMSDLFIVYTENYTTYNLGIKNRALAVKFVWWLNL